MKTIGLLGGMSWESTAVYYRQLNEAVRAKTGGLHSAKIILESVDFHDIHRFQHDQDWHTAGNYLADSAKRIEAAGADFLLLCTNTMHMVAPAIEEALTIPFLNLVDTTAAAIAKAGHDQIGLLGTRFTMEQPFYRERLERQGIRVLTPDADDRRIIHDIIYKELCLGIIRPESQDRFIAIINTLTRAGAQGVIAGCTEIGLLIGPDDLDVPLFDTTKLHIDAALQMAMD
ncbi:MAG: aspartate/glutamate racemase family protein [Alphaproteobacteria bacterium]